MPALSSHANVWSTCLQVLHQKGFTLSVELDPEDKGADAWLAERGGFDFSAANPIELLGLATVFETVQPKESSPGWWTVRGEGPSPDQLLSAAFEAREATEIELDQQRKDDPAAWAAALRTALDNSGGVADAASQLGISAVAMRTAVSQLPKV